MNKKWKDYEELELSSPTPCSDRTLVALISPVKKLWRSLIVTIQTILSSKPFHQAEPFIWQGVDHTGTLWWYVFDPMTGKSTYLNSEEDVRRWLEQLPYYR